MLKKLWAALRPTVLWSHRRGSWQYDVICALILAFIFLTPRTFFGDQPRTPVAAEIEPLGDDPSTLVFVVDAAVIDETPAIELNARLERMLSKRKGRKLSVVDVQPAPARQDAPRSYLVYARP
ncbi:MAG: hypothetical protein H6509_08155 [Bryobacterales bacterium]|nr:hypothetical protein [Bryobacterales bacterium]